MQENREEMLSRTHQMKGCWNTTCGNQAGIRPDPEVQEAGV